MIVFNGKHLCYVSDDEKLGKAYKEFQAQYNHRADDNTSLFGPQKAKEIFMRECGFPDCGNCKFKSYEYGIQLCKVEFVRDVSIETIRDAVKTVYISFR